MLDKAKLKSYALHLTSAQTRNLKVMEYAIEISNLVKRYPTTSNRDFVGIPHGRGSRGNVGNINALYEVLRGSRGPFIEALQSVNLKIKTGEIFGILGPNGAGKTTLIKILCTLVIQDEGEVYVNGFDPKKEPGKVLKNLQAVLPESRGFNWRLSGRQNLEFYALLYGLSGVQAKERIDYLLDFTNLTDRADDGYQRYSTGMQRRLLLCRALLRNTPIIVFDEPTTGLDPNSAQEFRTMIIDRLVKKEGKTILMSTHNLLEAHKLCDRLAILERGKIIALDTPDNVRHLAIEDRCLTVVFNSVFFGAKEENLGRELRATEGVHSVFTEVDQNSKTWSLTMRIVKDIDLNGLLTRISKSGLQVKSVNTEEPTLEEAFNAIIKNRNSSKRSQEGEEA